MPLLRQKLLTDFYRATEKVHEVNDGDDDDNDDDNDDDDDDDVPVSSYKSNGFVAENCQNEEEFPELLSSTESIPLALSPVKASSSKVIRTVIFSGKENRKRRRKLTDDSKQMIIDAGQKQFGHQQCNQCGMVYDYDSLLDQRHHQKFHGRFLSTKWFRVQTAQLDIWKRSLFCIIEQFEGNYSHIFCITQTSKCTLKTRIDKVISECVNKELGYTPDLAQVWTSDGRRQAWVYITAADTYYFIGALALVEKLSKEQLHYAEEKFGNCDVISTNNNVYMGVNRIWVHQTLRRRGIAALLLDHARSHFVSSCCVPREMIAFSSLTDSGLKFAKKYVPGGKVLLYSLDPEVRH